MPFAHRCIRLLPSLLLLLALAGVGPLATRSHAQDPDLAADAPAGMAEPAADAEPDDAEPDDDATVVADAELPADTATADLPGDTLGAAAPDSADAEAADDANADDIAQAPRTTPFDDSAEHPNRIAAPGYYPRILPAWKAGPIITGDVFSAPDSEYVDDATVLLQRDLLTSADPLLRARTALQLGTTGNRLAFDLLSAAVAAEQDPAVLATLLNAQRIIAAPEVVATALRLAIGDGRHPSRYVRLAAVQLYAATQGADKTDATRLAMADAVAREPDAQTRTAMLAALADQPGALPAARRVAFSTRADFTAPQRWAALGALAAHPAPDAAANARLIDAAKSPELGGRAAIAFGLGPAAYSLAKVPGQKDLGSLLMIDEHPAVRAAFAESLGRIAEITAAGRAPAGATRSIDEPLLQLTKDSDLEVRYQATSASAHATDVDKFMVNLSQNLGDHESVRIRRAAEASLIAQGRRQLTDAIRVALRSLLADANPERRYHAARVVAALRLAALSDTLIARLATETDTRVLVTEVDTLSDLLVTDALASILRHAEHADPGVRAAVARAIGRFRDADSAEQLRSYVAEDPDNAVINAALEAMGLVDSDFSSSLLPVLTKTNDSTGRLNGASRGIACWSAARQSKPSAKLIARLEQQVTKPVIPTPMGPIFEDDSVRVSATLALIERFLVDGNHDVEVKVRRTLGMLAMKEADATGNNPPPTGPQLREAAWQLRAYLNGQAPDSIQPHTAPVTHPVLDYRPLSN